MNVTEFMGLDEASHLAILGIISTLIILSNIFCLIVLQRATSGIKTATRIFLVSLSLADLGIGVLAIPFKMLIIVVEDETLRQRLCEADIFVHGTFVLASLESVIGITIERYLAIELPFWHRSNVTTRRVYITTAWLWLTSLAPAIYGGVIAVNGAFYVDDHGWCTYNPAYGSTFIIWIDIVIYIALPFALISFIYVRIVILVRRHLARRANNDKGNNLSMEDRIRRRSVKLRKAANIARNRKSLDTFLLVFSTFMLIYLPTCVVSVLELTGTRVPTVIVDVSRFLFFCNGWVNNVVYAMRHNIFKNTAQSMVDDLRRCCSKI